MATNNAPWGGGNPNPGDEYGVQLKPMGLKVHYTFSKDMQDRCLARWPHTLQVQTIPLDERTTIGVVDLKICLQAVADCSPELASESDKDYTVYAYDYSEPDTPLVGQGMLSSGLAQSGEIPTHPKLVTGRVTRNMLAIFGNGVKETLEVKLKLTPVPRVPRNPQAIMPMQQPPESFPNLSQSASNLSENNEWHSFIQSNPHLGQSANVSAVSSPAMAPVQPFNPNYAVRNDFPSPVNHGFPPAQPGSRPTSAGPPPGERRLSAAPLPPPRPGSVNVAPHPTEEPASAPPPAPTAPKPQSRPGSRASRRGPTGRPRGRPSKKQQQAEGSTSGVEENTDADEGPARKKRAKVTQVGRSNSATFGSEPDSLRVAASNAQSIRSFRPVGVGGEVPSANHLQDVPRAPTPVPDARLSGLPQARSKPTSGLRCESMPGQGTEGPFNSSFTEAHRSGSQGLDARSPVDSLAPSPSQFYSDEASPAEIGSSPPIPRSALYSAHSSPMPSSPVLPPMRMPASQPDSGFMSGGFDDSRVDDEDMGKTPKDDPPQVPVAEKPKPKRVRSRAKKEQPKPPSQQGLIIQEINPGPPELLPKTSIYNPPNLVPRRSAAAPTLPTPCESSQPPPLQGPTPETQNPGQVIQPPMPSVQPSSGTPPVEEAARPMPVEVEHSKCVGHTPAEVISPPEEIATQVPLSQEALPPMSPEEEAMHQDFSEIERLLNDYRDNQTQQYLDSSFELEEAPLTENIGNAPQIPKDERPPSTSGSNRSKKRRPASRVTNQEPSAEPELPMVPASDPVLPQLALPFPMSEAPHPETDAVGPPEAKANKNFIKRQAIKQKLEEAIAQGEMPTYCRNCAALQTPTWRKIWRQEHRGVPEYHEYSEKAGHVTAINVLERDGDGKSVLYEMIKKALGPNDDRSAWTEVLLCNPCGIWFSKWKAHRPPDKWEKDEKRLSQVRKKRANGSGASRSKKSRTKSDAQMNPTSEAGLPTDPLGPPEGATSPGGRSLDLFGNPQVDGASNAGSGKERKRTRANEKGPGSTHSRASTHSRGSGTPGSPITFNDELGHTRRLLFPSPRKDNEQKVLGEVAVNIVQTPCEFGAGSIAKGNEGGMVEKENSGTAAQQSRGVPSNDEFADLFGTPPARPSTPPPSSAAQGGPFKTPTRPTPSHRPITRSVSKSLRSVRSVNVASPSQALTLDRTPSRTPRSGASTGIGALTSSAMRRRSPRNHQNDLPPPHHPHHLLDEHQQIFADSPFTKSLNQLLSEANDFVAPPTPNRRGGNGNHHPHHHNNGDSFALDLDDPNFDFGSLLSGDNIMPSSPPMLRGGHQHHHSVNDGVPTTASSHQHHHMAHFGPGLSFDDPNMNLNLWNPIPAGDGAASTAADLGHASQVGDGRQD